MKSAPFCLASFLVVIAAHAANPAPSAAAPDVHDLMKRVIAVQAQVVWDVSNNAQDDNGNPDASKMKAADWAQIADAATKMKQAARSLAEAKHVIAAAPGVKIDGEGATPEAFGAKQVQAVIDAKPQVFAGFAQALAASMDTAITAARTKDAKKLGEVSGTLDQICEQCHLQFWYPNQKTP